MTLMCCVVCFFFFFGSATGILSEESEESEEEEEEDEEAGEVTGSEAFAPPLLDLFLGALCFRAVENERHSVRRS